MYTIDNATSVSAKPDKPTAVQPVDYWFTDGDVGEGIPATVIPAWFLNMLMAELGAIAKLQGASLDRTNDTQCATALNGIKALRAFSADSTANQATTVTSFLLGTTGSRVRGSNLGNSVIGSLNGCDNQSSYASMIACNAVTFASGEFYNFAAACVTGAFTGTGCAALASQDANLSGDYASLISSKGNSSVGANHSAALACNAVSLSANAGDGFNQFAGACNGSALTESYCAALACGTGVSVDGDYSAALACTDVNLTANKTGALAADGVAISATGGAAMACGQTASQTSIDKPRSAVVASTACAIATGVGAGHSAIVASKYAYESDDYVLSGGFDPGWTEPEAGNRTWAIESLGGSMYVDGDFINSGADYAELFPNAECVPLDPGYAMTLADEGSARLACKGDSVLGVVSCNPTVVGNESPFSHHGRWLRDIFGRRVMAPNVDGEQVPQQNPEWDAARAAEYKRRRDRPEQWVIVGLMGQLPVRVTSAPLPGQRYLTPSSVPGVFEPTSERTNVRAIGGALGSDTGHTIIKAFVSAAV